MGKRGRFGIKDKEWLRWRKCYFKSNPFWPFCLFPPGPPRLMNEKIWLWLSLNSILKVTTNSKHSCLSIWLCFLGIWMCVSVCVVCVCEGWGGGAGEDCAQRSISVIGRGSEAFGTWMDGSVLGTELLLNVFFHKGKMEWGDRRERRWIHMQNPV